MFSKCYNQAAMKLKNIWEFFVGHEYVFQTDFGVEECEKILKSSIDPNDEFIRGSRLKELIGTVEDRKFSISKKSMLWGSFWNFDARRWPEISFNGKFIKVDYGTKITGKFGLNENELALLIIPSLIFLFLFFGGFIIGILPWVLITGITWYRIRRYAWRQFILDFLQRTLEAKFIK